LIVSVTLAIFLAGTFALELAVVLIACRVGFEAAFVSGVGSEARVPARSSFAWMAGAGLAMATASLVFAPEPAGIMIALALMVALIVFAGIRGGRLRVGLQSLLMARVLAFPGLAVCALALSAREPRCQMALLLAFFLTEVFDSFSLLGGHLFGRRKLFPRLSPNKTIEGLLTGLAALIVTAFLLPALIPVALVVSMILSMATAVAAVAGDLLGSVLKRAAAVKDYPTVLRGQGGLLDILDAWLVTGPVLAALWLALS
jgi:phosphatidate cytidylyltransferase